jgi:hypothetical protein
MINGSGMGELAGRIARGPLQLRSILSASQGTSRRSANPPGHPFRDKRAPFDYASLRSG